MAEKIRIMVGDQNMDLTIEEARHLIGTLRRALIERIDPISYGVPSASSIEKYGTTARPRPLSSFGTDGGTASRETYARKE